MYAKYLGSTALITSLILEHREDESLLKLSHRFRASHTGLIHLQDDTLKLFLHNEFPLTESRHVRLIASITTKLRKGLLSEEKS